MSTLSGLNITVSGAVLNVQSSTLVVSGGYSNYIPGKPSGTYDWLERTADFEKLEAAKKPLMKIKEWLDYKKLEKVIEEKWGATKDNNSSGEEDRPRTYLLYGD